MTSPATGLRNLPKSALEDYVRLAWLMSTYLALWILLKEQTGPMNADAVQALRDNHNRGRSCCRDRAKAATKAGRSSLSEAAPALYSPVAITTTEELLFEVSLLAEKLIERMTNDRRPLYAVEWLNVDRFLIRGLVLLSDESNPPC